MNNMTMDEFYRTLHSNVHIGYNNRDYEVTAENLHQFAARVDYYQTEHSDGGTDVTVDEMMLIAKELEEEYDQKNIQEGTITIEEVDEKSQQKPWWKFW